MTGAVDEGDLALVPITIRHPLLPAGQALDAWVDTGFTGELQLTPTQVTALGLPASGTAVVLLADGSRVEVMTHSCLVEWFGQSRTVDALIAPGRFALIGVRLLKGLVLTIDYSARTMTLLPGAAP